MSLKESSNWKNFKPQQNLKSTLLLAHDGVVIYS